jgi:hypothetical protein
VNKVFVQVQLESGGVQADSMQTPDGLQMDSRLMIQKNIHLVVFKVDSTWTEWSPSGLCRSPGGVQPECVGECKVHQHGSPSTTTNTSSRISKYENTSISANSTISNTTSMRSDHMELLTGSTQKVQNAYTSILRKWGTRRPTRRNSSSK